MIITALIYFLSLLISTVIPILPSWAINETWINSLNSLWSNALSLSDWSPAIPAIFSVIAGILSFELIFWTTKLIISILNFFRGSGEIKLN
jgi:hypothetical protein